MGRRRRDVAVRDDDVARGGGPRAAIDDGGVRAARPGPGLAAPGRRARLGDADGAAVPGPGRGAAARARDPGVGAGPRLRPLPPPPPLLAGRGGRLARGARRRRTPRRGAVRPAPSAVGGVADRGPAGREGGLPAEAAPRHHRRARQRGAVLGAAQPPARDRPGQAAAPGAGSGAGPRTGSVVGPRASESATTPRRSRRSRPTSRARRARRCATRSARPATPWRSGSRRSG